MALPKTGRGLWAAWPLMHATVLSKPCFTNSSNNTSPRSFHNYPPRALHCLAPCGGNLKCGRLEHGFLRARRDTCHAERLAWRSVASAAASHQPSGSTDAP